MNLKKTLPLVFALLLTAPILFGQENPAKPYIEVTGRAEKEIEPDLIYISIVINEKDNKGKKTVAELEVQMFSALKSLGYDLKKDLKIKELSSNFRNRGIFQPEIDLMKSYQLTAKDAKITNATATALEALGISNISIVKTSHSAIELYKKEVRAQAMRMAREIADAMAVAIGQEIGRAILIQEQYCQVISPANEQGRFMKTATLAMDMGGEPETPDLGFENIKIDCAVSVRFELK